MSGGRKRRGRQPNSNKNPRKGGPGIGGHDLKKKLKGWGPEKGLQEKKTYQNKFGHKNNVGVYLRVSRNREKEGDTPVTVWN